MDIFAIVCYYELMKRFDTIKILILVSLCILLCSGCSQATTNKTVDLSEKQLAKKSDADITIPSILMGDEISQIHADTTAADNGDGTVTYALKGDEIDSILHQISVNISDSIQDILDNDDYYPNITAITHDADYTSFTISLSDGQMCMYESMLVMSFYTIGNRYQIYNGVPPEQAVTTVIYINDADNTVVSKSDSTSVETFSPNDQQ